MNDQIKHIEKRFAEVTAELADFKFQISVAYEPKLSKHNTEYKVHMYDKRYIRTYKILCTLNAKNQVVLRFADYANSFPLSSVLNAKNLALRLFKDLNIEVSDEII